MSGVRPDPGYGDPNAPVGSAEWAKRWRLCFQTAVKSLPDAPAQNLRFYEIGTAHRAWTLVTDGDDKPFADFDAFCRCRQPYGLGMDPTKFKAYLEAEVGKKQADLITVAPGDDKGGRPKAGEETAASDAAVIPGSSKRKAEQLRAILRAPELTQALYRADLMTQADAAKMGPAKPTPERAAQIAEARQELERIDCNPPRGADEDKVRAWERQTRKQSKAIVASYLGGAATTTLEQLKNLWKKATPEERQSFLSTINGE